MSLLDVHPVPPRRAIIAAPPAAGELGPLLAIGQSIQRDGVSVVVVSGPSMRAMAEDAGLTFASTPPGGAGDWNASTIAEDFAHRRQTEPGPEQLDLDFAHCFIAPMAEQHAVVQTLLAEEPDSVLIANGQFYGGWPVALGAPGRSPGRYVGVGVVVPFLTSRDTTMFGPAPVLPGEDQHEANRVANERFLAGFATAQGRLERELRGLGVTGEIPSAIDGMYTVPDAFASLTAEGFEFARADAPDGFHLVGALPAPHPSGWRAPDWWGELDGGRPVIVVTQGTVAVGDLTMLIEPALRGLAAEDVTVVATTGRAGRELSCDVPANAHVVDFVPFGALLPKADLLITNGGTVGTQQALSHGVPVIVAGTTEDKPATARRIAVHGLGMDLATDRPTPEDIVDAVHEVLASPDVRGRVTRLAATYRSHDPITEIRRLAGIDV